MIYLITSATALTIFLVWMYKNIGIPQSISATFYDSKTRWTYTAVVSGIGALMIFIDHGSLLSFAGLSLVLGTAAPDFKDTASLSMQLHYGLTATTAVLAGVYLFGLWGLLAGVVLGVSTLIDNKIPKAVFWAEILLFYTAFTGVFLKLLE